MKYQLYIYYIFFLKTLKFLIVTKKKMSDSTLKIQNVSYTCSLLFVSLKLLNLQIYDTGHDLIEAHYALGMTKMSHLQQLNCVVIFLAYVFIY